MRKLFFPFVVLLFAFASCTSRYPGDTVLVNHSSRTLTLNFTGTSEITLAPHGEPGSTMSLTTLRGVNPIQRMQGYTPNKRVRFEYTNSALIFKFFDRQVYEVKISNFSGYDGKLSADGWMKEISFSSSTANQENPDAWLVYTSRPRFTAVTENHSVSVSHKKTGNVFYVTIR
ncbi:MAG: hypothetical protein LBG93_02850 [Treponema sp.]|jgi:hypothetical protein|nr:hypothetical protein [Treponema sp.]